LRNAGGAPILFAPGPSMQIEIVLNGGRAEAPAGCSVAELVASLGLAPAAVAVERNERLVRRSEHATTRLAEGDRIELVTLVGGG
jgi:sulfur carrier protein